MTPAQAIAMLDRQIAAHGQDLELRRIVADAADDLVWPCRGFVRQYKPAELIGGIMQGDSQVVLSPSGLAGGVFAEAAVRRLDRVMTAGRQRLVEVVEPVYLANVLVRLNLQVRG